MTDSCSTRHERFGFPDKASFLEKIHCLGLDIPFSEEISPLFEPLDVAGKRLPNRIAVHPMEGADGDEEGKPTELTFRRYHRYAAGGSGLIWFEATAIHGEARSNPRQLCMSESTVDDFKRLLDHTRRAARESMGHDVLLILQLTHPGRYCKPGGIPLPVIAQHNPVLDPLQKIPPNHPVISDDELLQLQDKFLGAAHLAARAGFDGADIKACHGYLVSELLASFTREGSRYGGSFENRTRFLLETAQRMGEEVADLFATARINAFDGLPYPYGFGADEKVQADEDLTEPKALINRFQKLGCPLLNISLGVPRYNPHFGRPYDFPLKGGKAPSEHPLAGVSRLIRITGALQQEVPGLPLVGTGYSWLRRFMPHVGAAVIKEEKAAILGIGRGAFAYPDWVKDLKDQGRLNPEKVCIGCSCCSQLLGDGESTGCVVRDREVYLPRYRAGRRRAKIRKEQST